MAKYAHLPSLARNEMFGHDDTYMYFVQGRQCIPTLYTIHHSNTYTRSYDPCCYRQEFQRVLSLS